MKAGQRCGLLSPACQEHRPAGRALGAPGGRHSSLRLPTGPLDTDSSETDLPEKSGSYQFWELNLRVQRVRKLRDSVARTCLRDSRPVYTGLLPAPCI